MNDTIQVKKMLEAILKSQNNIHWIGGYVYGRTSNDDPFVILYPAGDYLEHKVCRVYEHDFKKLPDFIPTGNVPADTDNNPDKSKAIKRGIFHECPLFKVVLFDGKETQMGNEKRFSDVLYVSRQQPAQQQPQPNGRTEQDYRDASQPAVNRRAEADADHWTQEALKAVEPLMFDTAVARLYTYYGSADNVTKTRDNLFGLEYDPAGNAAYLAGLETYQEERQAREKAGKPTLSAHAAAKVEALNRYNRMLERVG